MQEMRATTNFQDFGEEDPNEESRTATEKQHSGDHFS
jgi:hypothetical protein